MKNETLTAATIEELQAQIKTYLGRYNPCGYDTKFKEPKETATGWSVEVSRYTSCD